MTVMINLIYIAQIDTNGVLTALYIVIKYIQGNESKHHSEDTSVCPSS